MSPRNARDRLKAYMVQEPNATASQATKAVGVSRQRIHAIADEEGISFGDGSRIAREGDLGSAVAPPRLSGRVSTQSTPDAKAVAALHVAADLLSRGYEIFLPAAQASFHLVAHDPGTGSFEGFMIEVQTTDRRAVTYARQDAAPSRLAIVRPDGSITYRPDFLVA